MNRLLTFFVGSFLFFGGSVSSKNNSEADSLTRVAEEIGRGKVARENITNILDNKYIVSALYYSDHFFEKVRRVGKRSTLQNRILLGLKTGIVTPELRDEYTRELTRLVLEKGVEGDRLVFPLDYYRAKVDPRSHPDAVDLFTKEGSSVYSMTVGIVVLAEKDWSPNSLSKIVSNNGGNEVIVFASHTKQFYRYCHLASVTVGVKDVLTPGQTIGTVGHTGSASQRGHGEHLHLEINQYDGKTTRYLSQKQLLEILKGIRK